jgi:hypothetical protein
LLDTICRLKPVTPDAINPSAHPGNGGCLAEMATSPVKYKQSADFHAPVQRHLPGKFCAGAKMASNPGGDTPGAELSLGP